MSCFRYKSVWLLLLAVPLCTPARAAAKPKKAAALPALSTAQYVGSQACSRCHAALAGQFAHASMGHSLTAITPEFLKTLPLPASYYDARTDHHYEVRAEDGKLVQTEFQVAHDGTDVFRNTHAMEWIVGTGENGYGALLRRDGYLFQAPLSYYTRAAKWDLSPGYQNGDYGFNRIILPGCIYCHSGRPQPVAGATGKYSATVFTQTSVGCENCHGPGSIHVAAMGDGDEFAKGADPTIVNPANLTGKLSDELCMSCHQTGDARVLKPGKTYQDFRPGVPLDQTFAIFQLPPTRENPPQDDHVEHSYSMMLSKCYRATEGTANAMRCITCHDPHVEPASAEAPAYYNPKCLSCHAVGGGLEAVHAPVGSSPVGSSPVGSSPVGASKGTACTAPVEARRATLPADNCIGCHMPKRDVVVISHSSITNHRILARPNEPFPEVAFQQTTPSMPDLIHLNAPAPAAGPPTLLTRLQAYADLKLKRPEYAAAWMKTLAELETAEPESALVQASLGHRELEAHRFPQAVDHLQHSLRIEPNQPEVYTDLSEVADQMGNVDEAIRTARKAVELDPFVELPQRNLIFRLINGKRYDQAQAAMVKYLENFPEDDFMRKMLAMATQ